MPALQNEVLCLVVSVGGDGGGGVEEQGQKNDNYSNHAVIALRLREVPVTQPQ